MSHPLIASLNTLASLLAEHPALAASKDVVKSLDKVAAAVTSATDLLENAAAGSSPEAAMLKDLLTRALATPADAKAVKAQLTKVLGKLPPAKKGMPPEEHLASVAVRKERSAAAITAVQQYLNRPTFDTSSGDKYELLKQIRSLGRMDEQQKKTAKGWLLSKPALVADLCAAAGIPTTSGKAHKPVATTSLVTKLMKHGERYAENTGG